MDFARRLWTRIEAIHAVTYFAPQSRVAATDAGLKGFWMGYFGMRAAPLGAVSPAPVEALFYNFAPRMVRRSLPDAWEFARPADLLPVRSAAAAAALRAVDPTAADVAERVVEPLTRAVARGAAGGRALFAANRDLTLPDDPVERLWQLCTTLREHRGDGHVVALTAAGVGGLEAHVLIAADRGTPAETVLQSRGWSPEEWAATADTLRSRGLLEADGVLTPNGQAVRERVEADTDRLAAEAYADLDEARREALLDDLKPLAVGVATTVIPYPNPIGLPPAT